MTVLSPKWTLWHSQSLAIMSSHCHHVSTTKYVVMVRSQFSAMHWTKQPCDRLIADAKKQGIQQKHATTAMETALCSGSPAFF